MSKKYLSIARHYEDCLEKHGDNHKGVDWPKLDDVLKRYEVMLDVIRIKDKSCSLLDFGCGAGHMLDFMQSNKIYSNVLYSGWDISDKFIQLCQRKYPNHSFQCLDILDYEIGSVNTFDYIVLNGVFTEKQQLSFEEMWEFFTSVLSAIFQLAEKGMAFNVMSKAVDWEREDLFHLSTDKLINFLVKNLSRNFVIRNDYGLYEYTVYLYK